MSRTMTKAPLSVIAVACSVASCAKTTDIAAPNVANVSDADLGACPSGAEGVTGFFETLQTASLKWLSVKGLKYNAAQTPDAGGQVGATLAGASELPGKSAERDLEVRSIPRVLTGMASEAAKGSTFLVSHATAAGQAVPTLGMVISIRPDGSAIFVGPCTDQWMSDLQAFAASVGPSGSKGVPADLVRQAIANPTGPLSDSYRKWQGARDPSAPTVKWSDKPADKRQVAPTDAPPEVLASAQQHRLVVDVPTDWFTPATPILDADKQSALCARSALGYGTCVVLQSANGPKVTLTAFTADKTQNVELVVLHGMEFESPTTVVGSVPASGLNDNETKVSLRGSMKSPTLTVE